MMQCLMNCATLPVAEEVKALNRDLSKGSQVRIVSGPFAGLAAVRTQVFASQTPGDYFDGFPRTETEAESRANKRSGTAAREVGQARSLFSNVFRLIPKGTARLYL
jgi:hypothetical protein